MQSPDASLAGKFIHDAADRITCSRKRYRLTLSSFPAFFLHIAAQPARRRLRRIRQFVSSSRRKRLSALVSKVRTLRFLHSYGASSRHLPDNRLPFPPAAAPCVAKRAASLRAASLPSSTDLEPPEEELGLDKQKPSSRGTNIHLEEALRRIRGTKKRRV